ncbi:MAG: FG-GAP-like repeat-containing protein, partial [Bacteroidota bacterium]
GTCAESLIASSRVILNVQNIEEVYGHGVSAADYDGDGDVDFYLCTEKGVTDRLLQNKDGRFRDVASSVGLNLTEQSRMALWFDFDNDRILDLVVTGESCFESKNCENRVLLRLFRQSSEGFFTDVTSSSGIDLAGRYDNNGQYAIGGLAAGDLDNDGFLDLILTMWFGNTAIFHNKGDGTFSDISVSSEVGLTFQQNWQPLVADFDLDGLQDIYICADGGPNQLWRNKGELKFENVAEEYRVDVGFSEMGLSVTDYDNDLDLDIYVTNITMGSSGNHLLKNENVDGKQLFVNGASALGVKFSGWDWGCTINDFNNDGWQDLAVTNGNLNWPIDQSQLWLNDKGRFENVSSEAGFDDDLFASTLVAFDADRDGDLDMLQSLQGNLRSDKPAIFYENTLNVDHKYVLIKPRRLTGNHFGIGATITIKYEQGQQMRLITAGTSFYGQEPAEAFFGVGDATELESVTIAWANNDISIYNRVPVNRQLTLWDEVVQIPTELRLTTLSNGTRLSWMDNSDNEESFEIQFSETPDFKVTESIIAEANSTFLVIPQLKNPEVYSFRIRALNARVSSPFSQTLSGLSPLGTQRTFRGFTCYPNPTTGEVSFGFTGPGTSEIGVEIFDMSGCLVFKKVGLKDDESAFSGLNLDLNPGEYLVQVKELPFTIASQKLIVK